jgi:Leu/Phe-tRNA-protein transferase
LDDEVRYYKGKHKVKILTRTPGNWIVEALEPFEDMVNDQRIQVKTKERRIVRPNLLYKQRSLSPPIKEHTYELKMEKRLKQIVQEKEEKTDR